MVDFSGQSVKSLVTACVLFSLVILYSWNNLFVKLPKDQMWDRHQYLTMAEGHSELVVKPFSKRILHPALAGFLSRASSLSLQRSFLALCFFLLALLVGPAVFVIQKSSGHPFMALPVLFSPYFALIFSDYLMHDLLFSALSALFFMTLITRRPFLALLILFLMFLTREATLLLAMVLLGVGLTKRRFSFVGGVLVVSVGGLFSVSIASGHGPSNIHALNEAFFMLGKFVYNFSTNFLGVDLWANTYHSCDPTVVWNVPSWIPTGLIREVGVCSFNILQPLHTLGRFLTIFGIGPSLLVFVLLKRGGGFLRRFDFWMVVCLVYGTASFLLGPCLGPGGYRLMGYGSPAFVLAGPALLVTAFRFQKRDFAWLFVIHVVLTWLPTLTTDFRSRSLLFNADLEKILVLLVAVIGQTLAVGIFRRSLVSPDRAAPVRSPS